MKTVAIIQARMSSSRLPGKVMVKLKDKTILEHVINRLKLSRALDDIVVATTENQCDDVIVEESKRLEIQFYRGSENDVLSRYYYAAKAADADIVVRVTSDCPVIDSGIVDDMIEKFMFLCKTQQIDYMSNTLTRTFPRGLDVEIIPFRVLEKAFYNAKKDYEREHVTPYIYQNPEEFRLEGYENTIDDSTHRWTLDTPEDLLLIAEIYNNLYSKDKLFSYHDILDYMDINPEVRKINSLIEQKKLD